MQSPVSPCLFDVLLKAESPLPLVKQEKVAGFLKLFNKWRSLSRRNGVAPLLRTILDDTERASQSFAEHSAILAAIKEKDVQIAQDCIRKHYYHIKQYYINKLLSRIHI